MWNNVVLYDPLNWKLLEQIVVNDTMTLKQENEEIRPKSLERSIIPQEQTMTRWRTSI